MKKSKQAAAILLAAMTMVTGLTGCGKSVDNGNSKNSAITVITRESGSGTRGAFIELFGIEEKNADGKKVDNTISSAEETNSTAVMITSVEGNESAIGYISLGALKSNVKALKVDGVEATTDNVKSGSYKVAKKVISAMIPQLLTRRKMVYPERLQLVVPVLYHLLWKS